MQVTKSGIAVTLVDEWKPIVTVHGPCICLLDGREDRTGQHSLVLYDADYQSPFDQESVRGVVGSIRHIQRQGSELKGIAVFASDAESQAIRRQFANGERVQILPSVEVLEGYQLKSGEVRGSVTGPMLVATRWRLLRMLTSKEW
ncbi:MAG: hypothetical protein ACK5PB_12815 [Pirellula sp.]|jgi:hypothetical protein